MTKSLMTKYYLVKKFSLLKVTKTFLHPLGANDNVRMSKLLFDEFIDGVKNGTVRSADEKSILNETKQKLRKFYNWNETLPFVRRSAQTCSDMLIHLGQFVRPVRVNFPV